MPPTRASAARSPSSCCPRPSPRIPTAWRASSARPRCSPRSTIRASRTLYGFEQATLDDGTQAHFLVMELGRGRGPGGAPRARCHPDRRGARGRPPDRRGPRGGPREGHRPPGPEARQRQARPRRQGEVARLRPGQGLVGGRAEAPTASAGLSQSPTLAHTGTAAGLILGHRRLHGARAGARQAGRQARRRLGLRRRAVRDAARAQAVRRRHRHRRARGGREGPDRLGEPARRDARPGAAPARALPGARPEEAPARHRRGADRARGSGRRAGRGGAPGCRLARGSRRGRPRHSRRPLRRPVGSCARTGSAACCASSTSRPRGCPSTRTTARRSRPTGGASPTSPGRTIRVRDLDRAEARELPGTEGARDVFWSPDGAQVGFYRDEALFRLPLDAAAPVLVARTGIHVSGAGACWMRDGRIVFSRGNTPLFEVRAEGGEPRVLVEPDRQAGDHHFHGCSVLPGDRGLLFAIHPAGQPGQHDRRVRGRQDAQRALAARRDRSRSRFGRPRDTSCSGAVVAGATGSGRCPSRSSASRPRASRSPWSRAARRRARPRTGRSLYTPGAPEPRAAPRLGLARGQDRSDRRRAAGRGRRLRAVARRPAHRGRRHRGRPPQRLDDRRRARHAHEDHAGPRLGGPSGLLARRHPDRLRRQQPGLRRAGRRQRCAPGRGPGPAPGVHGGRPLASPCTWSAPRGASRSRCWTWPAGRRPDRCVKDAALRALSVVLARTALPRLLPRRGRGDRQRRGRQHPAHPLPRGRWQVADLDPRRRLRHVVAGRPALLLRGAQREGRGRAAADGGGRADEPRGRARRAAAALQPAGRGRRERRTRPRRAASAS